MNLINRNLIKLTLDGAKLILEGVEKKAKEIGVGMDIAVVDEAVCQAGIRHLLDALKKS